MTGDREATRLGEALRTRPTADERQAQERAWLLLRAAWDADARAGARGGRRWRWVSIPALVVLALLAVASPPGVAVAELVRQAIGKADPAPPARPVAGRALPGGGTLLASGRKGPVVVHGARSQDRKLLGAVDEAAWSPRGRFVIVARGAQVIAVDRGGRRRWSIDADARVRGPRWSPDGFRVAYLAGRRLRVIAGDGTGGRALVRARPSIAPAWRPRTALGRHVVAYVEPSGRVAVRDADTGLRLGSSRARLGVRALAWTGDGSRLMVLTATRLIWLTPGGTSTRFVSPGRRQRFVALAAAGQGRSYATITRSAAGRSQVFLTHGRGSGTRFLFGVPGATAGLAFSPDGRWLAVASEAADAWLLLRPGPDGLTAQRAIAGVQRRLGAGSAPRLEGWCCAQTG